MNKIKNIIFDLGGVVIGINGTAAVKKFKEVGISNIEELIDPYRQKGLFSRFENGSLSREDFYAEICKMTGKNIDGKDIDRGFHDWLIPVEQEKLDYIQKLRKKYKVLLLSNTNDISISWARSEEFVPGGKPLDYYFDELYLSYKLGCVKPEPEIFQMVINLAGINPAETLYIDDGEENIAAGKALGFKTFLFEKENSFSEIEDRIASYEKMAAKNRNCEMKQKIIRVLYEENCSCVICNRTETRAFSKQSVIDLFNLYRKEPSFMEGAFVADKVVGKAAAALMLLGGVKYVYASVISEPALALFGNSGVEVEYDEKVPFIENISKTGWCPLETACYRVKTPEEIYPVIKNFVLKQNNSIN